jgi:hypothetical protein
MLSGKDRTPWLQCGIGVIDPDRKQRRYAEGAVEIGPQRFCYLCRTALFFAKKAWLRLGDVSVGGSHDEIKSAAVDRPSWI